MPVTREELGRRLRLAREARGLTQQDAARHLSVSRSTVAQMELGNRAVTSVELDHLATVYGRDLHEFLAEEFHEKDALAVLFRAHPDMLQLPEVMHALRNCVSLGRELTRLEQLLGVVREGGATAVYPLPAPQGRWQAVEQGERVSNQERRRLGYGIAPLGRMAELLETQGVRTAFIDLPEDVSGLTLSQPSLGIFVIANRLHPPTRRRFSLAHEYAHALLDRECLGTLSRASARDELVEVRANAFAASLLLPSEGVRQFMTLIRKGRPSRLRADVFDEGGVVEAAIRPAPKSQQIQMYDVAELAEHFGVSRLAALYRLRNLRFLSELELEALKRQEEAGQGGAVAALLDLQEMDDDAARNDFRHRFLSLALEAFRRSEISRAKLGELSGMIGLGASDLEELLIQTGLEDPDEGTDILLPLEPLE